MPRREDALASRHVRRSTLVTLQHALRTPTSAIIGFARMLLDSAPSHLQVSLSRIRSAGEELLGKIDQLVTRERIEGAHIDGDYARFSAELRRELGTPMHVILGYCEILLEDARGQRALSLAADVERIVDATRRLIVGLEQITVGEAMTLEAAEAEARDAIDHGECRPSDAMGAADPDARVLVVDDDDMCRELLSRYLERQGFTVSSATNGRDALERLGEEFYDLVLSDLIMPEMDGYQLLDTMRMDERLRHIPTIVVSALGEIQSVARCIELGAADYLPKTFNPTLLDARVRAVLERKRLHDQARLYTEQIRLERERSENLLLDVLPEPIAERLKLGEATIADAFPEVTVLFCDIVGFTRLSTGTPPRELVQRLNALFTLFDDVVDRTGVEKVKTMGDAYMLVSGAPRPRDDHAPAAARAALGMLAVVARHNEDFAHPLEVRVGLHSGPVVAGVIGRKRLVYDVWGDTVNVASRMESHGQPGQVQVTDATRRLLADDFELERVGTLDVNGKGPMETWLLLDERTVAA